MTATAPRLALGGALQDELFDRIAVLPTLEQLVGVELHTDILSPSGASGQVAR